MTALVPSIADLLNLRGNAFLNAVNARVASVHGVSPEAMLARGRVSEIARARHVAWALIYSTKRFSHGKIAAHYNRDRSTVLSGIATVVLPDHRAAA